MDGRAHQLFRWFGSTRQASPGLTEVATWFLAGPDRLTPDYDGPCQSAIFTLPAVGGAEREGEKREEREVRPCARQILLARVVLLHPWN